MDSSPAPLTKSSEIQKLARELSKESIIAFDTEFIRENTFYPIVEILQVASKEASWIVDLKAFPGDRKAELKPLWEVFQNPKILKVAHAIQGDQECLYTSFGVLATPAFDTASGAALLGLGENIGLAALLREVMGVELEKGHSRTNWSVRPLPDQLIHYALQDVAHLVECTEKLRDELQKRERWDWALELSAKWSNGKLYESDPKGITEKLSKGVRLDAKSFSILYNLVSWRETRVRTLNIPRKWLADDQVLVDLAKVKPKDLTHLAAFRGLNRGELKTQGAEILEAIRLGKENPLPPPKRAHSDLTPTYEEGLVIEFIKAYLNWLAAREKVSVRVLLTVAQILPILRADFETSEDLVEKGLLSEEVARLIGKDLVDFLKGKQALCVADRQILIEPRP
jgi:ribonuclease D